MARSERTAAFVAARVAQRCIEHGLLNVLPRLVSKCDECTSIIVREIADEVLSRPSDESIVAAQRALERMVDVSGVARGRNLTIRQVVEDVLRAAFDEQRNLFR